MTETCTAFLGSKEVASGTLAEVASKAKTAMDRNKWAHALIFDDVTAHQIDVDFSGTPQDILHRISNMPHAAAEESVPAMRGPGRPRLGVVAREVTLLPRHWDWLASQPGGASVALRKLVEHARHANQGQDRHRSALEAAYRFISAMAGNEPGFEEATRALFAGHRGRFDELVKAWPVDVRKHARKFASVAFDALDPAIPAPATDIRS